MMTLNTSYTTAIQKTIDVIRITSAGNGYTYYKAANDIARADLIRNINAIASVGDLILVGPGNYDFGHDTQFISAPGVTWKGSGMARTTWTSGLGIDVFASPAWLLQNNSAFEGMTLQVIPFNPYEDSGTIGMTAGPLPQSGFVRRCRLICNDWTVYSWNNNGNHFWLEDCQLIYGRHGVSMEGSGDSTSSYLDCVRCSFDGNATRSKSIGATSNATIGGVYGVVARGGISRIIDCVFNLVGGVPQPIGAPTSSTPRVASITDWFGDVPSGGTKIKVYNMKSTVVANGSLTAYDVDIRYLPAAQVEILDSTGSGANGALLVASAWA